MKVILAILKTIIGIINAILIISIIINVFHLILNALDNEGYISFLDYTYQIIDEDNEVLDLLANDVVLIDLKLDGSSNELVMYNDNGEIQLGKIIEVTEDYVILNNQLGEEITLDKEFVLGKVVNTIAGAGEYVEFLLSTRTLAIEIGILIVTSVIQSLLNKRKQKIDQSKPDFQQLSHV